MQTVIFHVFSPPRTQVMGFRVVAVYSTGDRHSLIQITPTAIFMLFSWFCNVCVCVCVCLYVCVWVL